MITLTMMQDPWTSSPCVPCQTLLLQRWSPAAPMMSRVMIYSNHPMTVNDGRYPLRLEQWWHWWPLRRPVPPAMMSIGTTVPGHRTGQLITPCKEAITGWMKQSWKKAMHEENNSMMTNDIFTPVNSIRAAEQHPMAVNQFIRPS